MTPDLVTHLDPRNVGMTIQLGKQAADEINQLHRERVATMAAEIEAMREAIISSYNMLKYFEKFTPNLVDLTEQQWLNTQEGKNTVSALAKLQPFIKP